MSYIYPEKSGLQASGDSMKNSLRRTHDNNNYHGSATAHPQRLNSIDFINNKLFVDFHLKFENE